MKIIDNLKKILNNFEDLFLSSHTCISCDIEIPDGSSYQLCDKCYNQLNKISSHVCEICGDKLDDGNLNIKICDSCKDKNYEFNSNHSFCYYDDISSNLIKKFKYSGKRYYARYLAKLMSKNKEIFDDVDIITFVPISKKGRAERGFNQAEELAKEISNLTKIPVENLLTKSKTSKHQARLTQSARLQNLIDSFSVIQDKLNKIRGKNILIIDDVFTTGTTLSECAKALKNLKPKMIKTYTFAKTDFNSINN